MNALLAEMAKERFARRTGKALVPSNASMNSIPPFNRFVSGANSADDIVRFSSPVADTEGVVNSDNSGMSLPAASCVGGFRHRRYYCSGRQTNKEEL